MARAARHVDDIINVNVGGKKYTVRRNDLCADPRSKLTEWFKPGSSKPIGTDKGGNFYLDRDPKSFRHILCYLRLKKEKFVPSLALPSKPDDLAKLVGECEALNLVELKELALEMLQKYQRTEEQHFVTSYVQVALRDYESWQFEKEQNGVSTKPSKKNTDESYQAPSTYDEWDNIQDTSELWNQELVFRRYIEEQYNIDFKGDYETWWKWTVDNYPAFWNSIVKFCGIDLGREFTDEEVVDKSKTINQIPIWFAGSSFNYTENVLNKGLDNAIAFIETVDGENLLSFTYAQLRRDVGIFANALKDLGLAAGDAVCGFVPNKYETSVAVLASAALGLVWSSCSTEFGPKGILDRFQQCKPKVLFVQENVTFKREIRSNLKTIQTVINQLETLVKCIVFPLEKDGDECGSRSAHCVSLKSFLAPYNEAKYHDIPYVKIPFHHPMYTMFSSGTTGLPKAMIHTVGGTLVKHVQEHIIQTNMNGDDTIMFYTTCGWMMWNWLMTTLFTGATIVLFDESPIIPDKEVMIKILANTKATIFGCGAKMYDTYHQMDRKFNDFYDLTNLRCVLSTGSPLKPSSFEFINTALKEKVCIGSICGGTDIIGCFMGASLNCKVTPGECQHLYLGMNCQTWNAEGKAVLNEQGELVCVTPFVSQPSHFLNDSDGQKYYRSYFEKNVGVWTHGDYCEIDSKTGGVIIYGRSDATLNRFGVRIGTADIYNIVENFEAIEDSLVVGMKDTADPDNELIVLFLKLKENFELSNDLEGNIKRSLRNDMSPRHVPNFIKLIHDIPYTHSGKKMELIIKQILNGEEIKNLGAVRNPSCLTEYETIFPAHGVLKSSMKVQ
uniref:Acetoacetyl-CoA synthetase n=1 Tax=Rhabditophanes sp. KR3021 TaxID=114890 RepID=A0AC35U8D0_9BILA